MTNFLKEYYGDTTGPIGVPMKDEDAKALDKIIDTLDEVEYQRAPVEKAMSIISEGERADISWISVESLDRHRDIVLSAGMDDSHYKNNPIVTVGHDYTRPPVGRSLWRKKINENGKRGIKAKTFYPPRPEDWKEERWNPDIALSLIKSGLMIGKSIGFLPLEASPPSPEEVKKNPSWADARRIVRRWLLLEYSCHWLPVNQDSVLEMVSKGIVPKDSLDLLGVRIEKKESDPPTNPGSPIVPHITEEEIQKAVSRQFAKLNIEEVVKKTISEKIEKLKGRV